MAEDSSFKAEKVTTENYPAWKFNMKIYLIGKVSGRLSLVLKL